jgi:hypothetical protein
MLTDELAKRRDTIFRRWFEDVIDGYPDKTGRFLKEQSDPFANPVGAGLDQGLHEILDGLVESVEPEQLEDALDLVIRVRAVQEFSPAAGVGFIFRLKAIAREIVGRDGDVGHDEWAKFDRYIDRLGLFGFDVYMRCREQMWAIRAREIRTQTLGILERVQEWRDRRVGNSGDA